MAVYPKFRTDLLVSELTEHGGKKSVVLKDPVTERFFRLSVYEFAFLRSLDGALSLEDAVGGLSEQGYYYSLEDARRILGKAAQLGLVLGTRVGTAEFQRSLHESIRKAKRARLFSSVYFLFLPLLNPDRFLGATVWIFRLIFNRITAVLVMLLLPGAVYLLIAGIPRIQQQYLFFFNWDNLLYLWAVIFFTKLAHEFSHAYAAKHFGLHVPQMGLAFLIFFPCLYCNTTDAWQLADRRQRIAISAAGIVAEAVLAILATYAWYFSKPGMVNSLAFNLMAVSFISTVLFNGNPIMKFDGYFILIDVLRVPNLATKALGYLKYLFMNQVLGIGTVLSTAGNQRDRCIFALYGPSAFIYRIFLYTGIVMGVYYRFDKTLGIVPALLALVLFVLRPIWKGSKVLYGQRGAVRPRFAGSIVFLFLVVVLVAGSLIPLSSNSVYPCFLAAQKKQKLTVPLQTWVDEVFIRQGAFVRRGTILYTLDTSSLELSLSLKEGRRKIIAKDMEHCLVDDKLRPTVAGKRLELLHVDDEIKRIGADLLAATSGSVAPFDGVITNLDPRMKKGFQPGEGVVVGELESPVDCVVHALIPEKDLHNVRPGQAVQVWFPIRTGVTFTKTVDTVRPYSERDLQDSPFSSRLGGELATEMKGEGKKDAPLDAQYQCSVDFPNSDGIPLGSTGRLVVPCPPQSIAARFFRKVLTTFNRESLL